MARLRGLLAGLGHEDVATYVQSGNAIFTTARPSKTVARELEKALHDDFGFEVPVIMRTRDEFAAVLQSDPFTDVRDDPARHLVLFGAAGVDQKAVTAVAEKLGDPSPEAMVLVGRELHLWCPDGLGRSPLNIAVTRAKLTDALTGRNWRTVQKLLSLADG